MAGGTHAGCAVGSRSGTGSGSAGRLPAPVRTGADHLDDHDNDRTAADDGTADPRYDGSPGTDHHRTASSRRPGTYTGGRPGTRAS